MPIDSLYAFLPEDNKLYPTVNLAADLTEYFVRGVFPDQSFFQTFFYMVYKSFVVW